MRVISLCSGYGGIELGLENVLDVDLEYVADIDPGASRILKHRFPGVPNLGDLTKIDWDTFHGLDIDVVTAGFPCQDVSQAGGRAGLRANTRTGVWYQVARAIDYLQPKLVLLENVRGLLSASADCAMEPCPWHMGGRGEDEPVLRALGAVLGDLADLGFDAEWATVPASAVGAPHKRERVFIAAWPAGNPPFSAWDERRPGIGEIPDYEGQGDAGAGCGVAADAEWGEFQRRRGCGVVGSPTAGEPGERHQRERAGNAAVDGGADAAYTEFAGLEGLAGDRVEGTWRTSSLFASSDPADSASPGLERLVADAAEGRSSWPDQGAGGYGPGGGGGVNWGQYTPAIRRWESVLGRPAPRPAEPTGRGGSLRLSAQFVEWMQGLPEGWVTGVPYLTRTEQLKALGNGCVPQQVAYAVASLLSLTPEVATV